MSGRQNIVKFHIHPTKVLEIQSETWKKVVFSCECVVVYKHVICSSVLNMLIMGLALRQCLVVISPLYNALQEFSCCCLHVNYIVCNTQVQLVVSIVVMGLVLGQSFIAISSTGFLVITAFTLYSALHESVCVVVYT